MGNIDRRAEGNCLRIWRNLSCQNFSFFFTFCLFLSTFFSSPLKVVLFVTFMGIRGGGALNFGNDRVLGQQLKTRGLSVRGFLRKGESFSEKTKTNKQTNNNDNNNNNKNQNKTKQNQNKKKKTEKRNIKQNKAKQTKTKSTNKQTKPKQNKAKQKNNNNNNNNHKKGQTVRILANFPVKYNKIQTWTHF